MSLLGGSRRGSGSRQESRESRGTLLGRQPPSAKITFCSDFHNGIIARARPGPPSGLLPEEPGQPGLIGGATRGQSTSGRYVLRVRSLGPELGRYALRTLAKACTLNGPSLSGRLPNGGHPLLGGREELKEPL